jgi:hypothetical protein
MIMRSSPRLLVALVLLVVLSASVVPGGWRAFPTSDQAGAAWAQQVMKFEPVPQESVAAEARRARRSTATPAIPAPPEPPEPPDLPESKHAGDIVRIGSDIHIPKDQEVEGDVFALRGDIRVEGHVKGNVAATGGDVSLGPTARVDGDVVCIGGKLEEEDGARVGGQRVTALRGGRGRRIVKRFGDDDWEEPSHDFGHLSFALSGLVVSLLLAWAVAKFAPARTGVALSAVQREPGLSLLLGLAVVVMLVPSLVALCLVMVVLCITIIGIPLALGALVAYAGLIVLLALWGYVVGVTPIGEQLSRRLNRPVTLVSSAVLGVLVVSGMRLSSKILDFMPLFGWFGKLLGVVAFMIWIVATMMGAGALVRTKFGQGPEGRWWPLFKPKATPPPGSGPSPAPPSPAPITPESQGSGEQPSPAG